MPKILLEGESSGQTGNDQTGYQFGSEKHYYIENESLTGVGRGCSDCLDPSTVGHNLLGLTYPGGDNPLTNNKDYTYQYVPKSLAEYPAIGHDRRYDNLKIAGAKGLFTDTRAIGADWRFVFEEYVIASNLVNSPIDRIQALILGTGLGLATLPKTLSELLRTGGSANIFIGYYISNIGVSNTPDVHKH